VQDHLADLGISRLAFGDNHLNVPLLDLPPGTQVRVRIGAQEVALALDWPARTSFQNILAGTVLSLKVGQDGQADVHLDVGATLWAKVTLTAVNELGLRPGDKVFAMIKSTSIPRSNIARRRGA
jgi:molybdate transport system ATP-binding protein